MRRDASLIVNGASIAQAEAGRERQNIRYLSTASAAVRFILAGERRERRYLGRGDADFHYRIIVARARRLIFPVPQRGVLPGTWKRGQKMMARHGVMPPSRRRHAACIFSPSMFRCRHNVFGSNNDVAASPMAHRRQHAIRALMICRHI